MPPLDDKTTILVIVLLVFIVIVLLELRFIRKKRMAVPKKEPLEDQAFNALLNAKAISNTLARDGTDLSSVNDLLGQASRALERGNYRVSLELTDRAKEMMRTVKASAEKPPEPEVKEEFVETEETTKETLRKKFPENYLESRFSRSLAMEAIEKAKDASLDVSEAERLLKLCDDCQNAEDYTQALSYAVQSKKVVEAALSTAAAEPTGAVESLRTCRSCGAEVLSGDMFCRVCGAKLATVCGSCGKKPKEGDVFCRSCGARIES